MRGERHTPSGGATTSTPALRRVLNLWQLVFYGLGVIVGAGIYVALGSVIERAGATAPLSFLLAGCAAALTGLCYADLARRYPDAAGAVSYVRHGFGSDRVALLTGIAVTLAVAIAAASIARGAAQYLAVLLPVHASILIAAQVGLFTAVAAYGVRESVGLAAVLGAMEIAGLIAAIIAGLLAAPDFHVANMVPLDLAGWRGTIAGVFIAFFAFIGFETLANLGEEVADPHRTLPRGIIGAIAASIVLYVAVSISVVLADSTGRNPLLGLFEGTGVTAFAAVGAVSVSNGVLVELVMLARLFYGMARQGQLPRLLGEVNPRTRTPIPATLLAGSIVLAAALLVPFERLLVMTNAVTLAVFVLVDLALWRIQRAPATASEPSIVPRWLPPCGAALSFGLLVTEIVFQL